jgi:pimeloyl-ACP methyl ester carboxylesterase
VRDFSATPALVTLAPRGAVRGVTLFVHGGRSKSVASGSRRQPPALRMYSFLMGVRRDGRGHGVAACQLRYGVRGYDEGDPVQDVGWALAEIARRHGEVPFSLVGHSMGGGPALRAAGAANVRAAAALAQWLPAGEPVAQPADSGAVVARGRRDRVTDPACSLEGRRLVREVVLASLGAWRWSARLQRAFALPDESACRVEL